MIKQPMQTGFVLIPGYKDPQDTQRMIRLEGNGNYTIIHFADSSKILMVAQTLRYFEEQIPNFIRVNKSALINPAHVDELIRTGPKTMLLRLDDGLELLVSRRRISDVIMKLAS
ncbi:LytTR family DNA-binding domain-containing protein [Spirosoma radiotolerans]|nr:LytTR family DNA-binding domain-containing protein [Spirosoma radiotolerans]